MYMLLPDSLPPDSPLYNTHEEYHDSKDSCRQQIATEVGNESQDFCAKISDDAPPKRLPGQLRPQPSLGLNARITPIRKFDPCAQPELRPSGSAQYP